MGAWFWLKRFCVAALPLFAILAAVEWFNGATAREDYAGAALWALAAAAIFTYGHWRRYRLAMPCTRCDDLAASKPANGRAGKR